MTMMMEIRPQPGPQTEFLSSSADVAVYGGAAGGGKTWALLLEPLRHVRNPKFGAVYFRRTYPQITNEGGLWDESQNLYPFAGGKPTESALKWSFGSGASVRFAHLQHEKDKYSWQGSQIALICFDELTHFTQGQFLYLLSRNRTKCGVRPYVRATTNPDADSWVKEFLGPWVDDEHPDYPATPGALRHFTHQGSSLIWVDPDWRDEDGLPGKSLTFVPASIYDNQALLASNPEYLANLRALPYVEQMRLLHGDWKVRPEAGKVFNRAWFEVVSAVPAGGVTVRFWDFAATAKKLAGDDPDWTVGVKISRFGGRYYVEDVIKERAAPAEVRRLVRNTASQDGPGVHIAWEVEPGSSGKLWSDELTTMLAGYSCRGVRPTGDKLQRAQPVAAQALAGNIKIVQASWNNDFLATLHGFPDLPHDDDVDGLSGGFNELVQMPDRNDAQPAAVVSRSNISSLLG